MWSDLASQRSPNGRPPPHLLHRIVPCRVARAATPPDLHAIHQRQAELHATTLCWLLLRRIAPCRGDTFKAMREEELLAPATVHPMSWSTAGQGHRSMGDAPCTARRPGLYDATTDMTRLQGQLQGSHQHHKLSSAPPLGCCFIFLARDHRATACRDPVRCFRCRRSGHRERACPANKSRRPQQPKCHQAKPARAQYKEKSSPPPSPLPLPPDRH